MRFKANCRIRNELECVWEGLGEERAHFAKRERSGGPGWRETAVHLQSELMNVGDALKEFQLELRTRLRDRGTTITVLLFTLIALPTTLLFARLVPLGEVPDEPTHVTRACSLLRGEIVAQRWKRYAGVTCDPSLYNVDWTFQPGDHKKLTAEKVRH